MGGGYVSYPAVGVGELARDPVGLAWDSEPKQPGELHDEGAVVEHREAATQPGITLIVVDDEELASRLILPPQPEIRAERVPAGVVLQQTAEEHPRCEGVGKAGDRKSTRLNSSHALISYAVFCLKKKNNYTIS